MRKTIIFALLICTLTVQAFAQGQKVDTELPVAGQVLSDGQAAPIAPAQYSYLMCFSGVMLWNRCISSQLDTYLQPASVTIIRSDNVNNDEKTQIKGTPGVLLGISGSNSNASTAAYVRCVNNTGANVAPGSTAINMYELMIPPMQTISPVQLGPAGITFSIALTCYVTTSKPFASGTTDAAVDDVVVNIVWR